jgi:vesicle coat complex subunit
MTGQTDNMPQAVKSTEEPPEQTLSATAAAMVELIKTVADTAVQTVQRLVEALKTAASVATEKMTKFTETAMYNANDNPRWWHLYKNAKKARIRKKYRRRLMNQLLSKLNAAQEVNT